MPSAEAVVSAREPGQDGQSRRARDTALARAGWTRRFTGAPPRLAEMRDLYERLGWEVLLDALLPDELPPGCGDCRLAQSLFQVVYTRRAPGGVVGGGAP